MITDDEFDDAVEADGYVSSRKARAAVAKLLRQHGLGYYHNLGGIIFFRRRGEGPAFECQVAGYDDVADLMKLREALKKSGADIA
jgi:hypothetical protein